MSERDRSMAGNQMSRRTFLRLSSSLALTPLLAACGIGGIGAPTGPRTREDAMATAQALPTSTPDLQGVVGTAVAKAQPTAGAPAASKPTEAPRPTAAPVAAKPTEAPAAPAAKPAEAKPAQPGGISTLPVPTEFDPAKGPVKNIQLDRERAPKNAWFHLKTRSGVDSYGTYWADCSTGAFLESHGNFGQVVVQFEEGVHQADVCVGVGTLDFYTDPVKGRINVGLDNKIGNKGQNPEWPNAVNIKDVAPGESFEVLDADTGRSFGSRGGSPKGDLMILLPEVGRRILRARLDDPTRVGGTREVLFWKGPADDMRDRNILDAR